MRLEEKVELRGEGGGGGVVLFFLLQGDQKKLQEGLYCQVLLLLQVEDL